MIALPHSLARLVAAGALLAFSASPALAALPTDAPGYTEEDAASGAQLRAHAGVAFGVLFHPCGYSAAMEPTMAKYSALRESIDLPSQHLDLAIAKADYDYRMSLIDITCPDLSNAELAEAEKIEIALAESMIDQMATIIQSHGTQDK